MSPNRDKTRRTFHSLGGPQNATRSRRSILVTSAGGMSVDDAQTSMERNFDRVAKKRNAHLRVPRVHLSPLGTSLLITAADVSSVNGRSSVWATMIGCCQPRCADSNAHPKRLCAAMVRVSDTSECLRCSTCAPSPKFFFRSRPPAPSPPLLLPHRNDLQSMSPPRQAGLLLLIFIIAPINVTTSSCVQRSPSPTPTVSTTKWYTGRYFYYSSDAPISSTLLKVQPFWNKVDIAIRTLQDVDSQIHSQKTRLLNNATNRSELHFQPPICNLQDQHWANSAQDQILLRGYSEKVDVSCVTDQVFEDHQQQHIFDLVYSINNLTKSYAKTIARNARSNFTNPDAIFNWPYNTATQHCHLNVLGAYRIQTNWYLNVGITNDRQEKHLEDFGRKYLAEGLGRNGKTALMNLYRRPKPKDADQTHKLIHNATTIIISHRDTADPGVFKFTPLSENLAVRTALDKADFYSQQVSDAISPSSIALLVLPLFLNLVPIALIADVSTRSTFIYALLSDVLTVIPLSIKGIELISIGRSQFLGAVVRISSSADKKPSPAAAAEIYVAKCHEKKNVVTIGITFLTISLVFLVIGLAAEVIARRFATRRKKRFYSRISLSSSTTASSRVQSHSLRISNPPVSTTRGAAHINIERESYDGDTENWYHCQ